MAQGFFKSRNHLCLDAEQGRIMIWSMPTLWNAASALPVEEVGLNTLPIDRNRWFLSIEDATVRSVANHCRRAICADLAYPIIIGPEGQVLDGMHRVVKALLQGDDAIRAVHMHHMPTPDAITNANGIELHSLMYERD